MSSSLLAIIIPAYKIDFFENTLKSIANQTVKDFNLYIGIDDSPCDFESIIQKYSNILNIEFVRFKNNLGRHDLVGQWNRCINLMHDEEWLWLFSDDDLMGRTCVEDFYRQLRHRNNYDIYHFNVKLIDEQDKIIKESSFPSEIDVLNLYIQKERALLESFVVEYIINYKKLKEIGGFVQFPMAWYSDIATCILIGKEKGIKTIENDYVYWRSSTINITPNRSSENVTLKIMTSVNYYSLIKTLLCNKNMKLWHAYFILRQIVHFGPYISRYERKSFFETCKNLRITYNLLVTLLELFSPFYIYISKQKKGL